jgi:hypothetical protein
MFIPRFLMTPAQDGAPGRLIEGRGPKPARSLITASVALVQLLLIIRNLLFAVLAATLTPMQSD